MELKVIREDDELTHLTLIGRVDLRSLEGLDIKFTTLTITRRKPTLIDLSEVDFMASIGLRMLLSAAKALDRHGLKMVILNPQRSVEEVFVTSGFDKVIPISHDLDKAMELLKS